jgi:phosphoglycolate phosphatase
LLHAAQAAGLDIAVSIYVGDDLRDVQAGRAAGMRTVAAAYGYLGDGALVEQWGADHVIHRPDDLLPLVRR